MSARLPASTRRLSHPCRPMPSPAGSRRPRAPESRSPALRHSGPARARGDGWSGIRVQPGGPGKTARASAARTRNSPSVAVPVLSRITRSTDSKVSSTRASRIRIPRREAAPTAAVVASGVAMPSAQGQAMTRTAMARIMASVNGMSGRAAAGQGRDGESSNDGNEERGQRGPRRAPGECGWRRRFRRSG